MIPPPPRSPLFPYTTLFRSYESGMPPVGSAHERFSVKFYLVGMLFILFDIEAVFLYPWVVVYRELKMFAFVEMLLFIVLILAGYFYIWKKGALDWSGEPAAPAKPLPASPAALLTSE